MLTGEFRGVLVQMGQGGLLSTAPAPGKGSVNTCGHHWCWVQSTALELADAFAPGGYAEAELHSSGWRPVAAATWSLSHHQQRAPEPHRRPHGPAPASPVELPRIHLLTFIERLLYAQARASPVASEKTCHEDRGLSLA